MDQQSISNIVSAYKAGKMSPQQAADFERDVREGNIMLPRGVSIDAAVDKTQAKILPVEITNAYTRGLMSKQQKQDLEADIAAGKVRLTPTIEMVDNAGFTPEQIASAQPQPEKPMTMADRALYVPKALLGNVEAAATVATGMTTGLLGNLTGRIEGTVNTILNGNFNTPEGRAEVERMAAEGAARNTYMPKTDMGQMQVGMIAEAANILPPVMPLAAPMGGVGAAVRAQAGQVAQKAMPQAVQAVQSMKQPLVQAAQAVKAAPAQIAERVGIKSAATAMEAPQAVTAPVMPKVVPREIANHPALKAAAETAAPVAENVAIRDTVLDAIGLPPEARRLGSQTGNRAQIGQEKTLSKLDAAEGQQNRMAQQFQLESEKLGEYASSIQRDTGGSIGANNLQRGEAISAPLEAYQNWYDGQVKQVYSAANEAAAGQGGIRLSTLKKAMDEPANFKGDGRVVRADIRNELKRFGVMDDKGNILPIDAKTAENIRQAANASYDAMKPQTQRAVSIIKNAIDEDVMAVLPADAYQPARAMARQYHELFTSPKGISKILDIEGSGGINRAVSLDMLPDQLANWAAKDTAQFQHVARMLENLPTPELQAMGKRAIAEIRSHVVEKIIGKNVDATEAALGGRIEWRGTDDTLRRNLAPYKGKLDGILGKELADRLETLKAGARILRPYDPNPSGTATVGANISPMMRAGLETAGAVAGFMAGGGLASLPAAIGGRTAVRYGINKAQQAALNKAIAKSLDPAEKAKMAKKLKKTEKK